jgi:hypothetical protein
MKLRWMTTAAKLIASHISFESVSQRIFPQVFAMWSVLDYVQNKWIRQNVHYWYLHLSVVDGIIHVRTLYKSHCCLDRSSTSAF